jgi:hypothetical protein
VQQCHLEHTRRMGPHARHGYDLVPSHVCVFGTRSRCGFVWMSGGLSLSLGITLLPARDYTTVEGLVQ